MSTIKNIILIHPTKCAGTTISKRILKLKGYSDFKSKIYSGYNFNLFFQKNIKFFHFIIHTKNLMFLPTYIIFYIICLFFALRNSLHTHKFGLTFLEGSYQHLTYRQLKNKGIIHNKSITITIIRHPQERIVSAYYFLGYHYYYNFIEFLERIKNGCLTSSIIFIGYKAIIQQHITPMYEHIIDDSKKVCVDFILRNESLDADWKKMCHLYSLKYKPLNHINKTKNKQDWKSLYKKYPKASQVVYDLYKKDFEYFNYKIYY